MSYEACEAALKTQIEAIGEDWEEWVTLADWRILAKGVSKRAVILQYDGFEHGRTEFGGGHRYAWRVKIWLFARYMDDVQVHNQLRDDRHAILDRIAQYPKLGGASGVFDALIETGSEEPEAWEIGGVVCHVESMDAVIAEDVEVEEQE